MKKFKLHRTNKIVEFFDLKSNKSLLQRRWVRFGAGVITIVGIATMLTTKIEIKPEKQIYIVQEDDKLWNIANQYGVTVEEITTLNNIENPHYIVPGQEIEIPIKKESNKPEDTEPVFVDIDKIIGNWNKSLEKNGHVQGIDISFAQTDNNIDLRKVLEENPQIQFVIVRTDYFIYNKRIDDDKINEYAKIAKEHNVAFGIYYWPNFSNIENTKEELDIVMKKIKDLEVNYNHLTMPIFLDIETKADGGGTVAQRIKDNDEETIKNFEYVINYWRKNGYEVMIYSGANCAKPYKVGDLAQKYGVELWIAQYGNHDKMHIDQDVGGISTYDSYPHVGRQYSMGYVDGYKDEEHKYRIDLNLFYRNLPEEILDKGLNNTDQIKGENKILKFFKNLF